jgi:hypothetical protein
MWNITSNNVRRAKEQLQLRRGEIETRYAEENRALDAELAVIETLERAAAEFMLRHSLENGPSELSASTDPPGGNEADSSRETVGEISPPAWPIDMPSGGEIGSSPEGFAPHPVPEIDRAGSDEAKGSLDILKPGSRWRLYRGNRPTDPEDITGDPSPTTG